MASGLEAFTPQGLTYARSITASQVNAATPTGFSSGGKCALVYNSSTTVAILIAFYVNAQGAPPLIFPIDGAPPTGQPGTVLPPGVQQVISIPANCDSFAAIGSAAGPTLIYVQRGEGL